MNIKDEVKKYYDNAYSLPLSSEDLEHFGKDLINRFVEELELNKATVNWGYGLDSVVFVSKQIEDNKSIRQIKEEFLGERNDKSNKADEAGK